MTTQEMLINSLHNLETLKGMNNNMLENNYSWGSIMQVQREIQKLVKHIETLEATLKAEIPQIGEGV